MPLKTEFFSAVPREAQLYRKGDLLTPQAADGILAKAGAADADMQWQVVQVYTMPDHQPGVKIMRIK